MIHLWKNTHITRKLVYCKIPLFGQPSVQPKFPQQKGLHDRGTARTVHSEYRISLEVAILIYQRGIKCKGLLTIREDDCTKSESKDEGQH